MKIIKIFILGSGLGIFFIFAPLFFITNGFKNASSLEFLVSFLSGVITGIIGVFIATKLLPPKFSLKTIIISIIALPIGSLIYAIIAGFLFLISHQIFSFPARNLDLLTEANNAASLTILVYGHIFFPLSLIATTFVQCLISKEYIVKN